VIRRNLILEVPPKKSAKAAPAAFMAAHRGVEFGEVVAVNPDKTVDVRVGTRSHPMTGIRPSKPANMRVGDHVHVGHLHGSPDLPFIFSVGGGGTGQSAAPRDANPIRARLSGLWPQWEGSPELGLQPGAMGKAFAPNGFSQWVADQSIFADTFFQPLLWSSPILWPSKDNTGQRMALLYISATSNATGAPLQLWLEVFGPGETDPYLSLINRTLIAEYPALWSNGTALQVNGEPDWGVEFLPSKLHYLPSSDQLVVLGPGFDVDGRRDVWVCSSAGAIVQKSILSDSLNTNLTVAPYALVAGSWHFTREVSQATSAVTDTELTPDGRKIRGYKLSSDGKRYSKTWELDPLDVLPGGAGLKILKPVTSAASGRNDRRWPYSTVSNAVAISVSGGVGAAGSLVRNGFVAGSNNGPDDIIPIDYMAWANTRLFTQCSMVFSLRNAETGAELYRDVQTVDGYNNWAIESGTFGYENMYGPGPRYDPDLFIGFLSSQGNPTDLGWEADGPDYHLHGDLPLSFPLRQHNSAVGNSAVFQGSGGSGGLYRIGGGEGIDFSPNSDQMALLNNIIGSGAGTSQAENSHSGCFDKQASYYTDYAMPELYKRGGPDAGGWVDGYNVIEYPETVIPDVGTFAPGSKLFFNINYVAKVDQHFRTYLRKIVWDGKKYVDGPKLQVSQDWVLGDVLIPQGGLAFSASTRTLSLGRPALEQRWAMAAVVSDATHKIRELLFRLADTRTELAQESRPVLQVWDSVTLDFIVEVQLCLTDVATATDGDEETYPNTVAVEGRYLYDSRNWGTPQMRCILDDTVPGAFGQGGAAVQILIYHSDRRDPGAVIVQRMHTIVFGDANVYGFLHSISQATTYPTPEDYNQPQSFDTWAQGSGGRAFYREGNVFSASS